MLPMPLRLIVSANWHRLSGASTSKAPRVNFLAGRVQLLMKSPIRALRHTFYYSTNTNVRGQCSPLATPTKT